MHLEDQEVYGDRRYASVNTSHTVLEKDVAVDTWIDTLTDSYKSYESSEETSQSNQEIILTWMSQKNSPQIRIPIFDSSMLLWVECIIKFKDIVNNKSFLCITCINKLLVKPGEPFKHIQIIEEATYSP